MQFSSLFIMLKKIKNFFTSPFHFLKRPYRIKEMKGGVEDAGKKSN